jgi:hypothetical protein
MIWVKAQSNVLQGEPFLYQDAPLNLGYPSACLVVTKHDPILLRIIIYSSSDASEQPVKAGIGRFEKA